MKTALEEAQARRRVEALETIARELEKADVSQRLRAIDTTLTAMMGCHFVLMGLVIFLLLIRGC